MNILFFHPADIFKVIGSTEPYYLLRYLSARHSVTAIVGGESSTDIPSWAGRLASLHRLPRRPSLFLGNLWYNLRAVSRVPRRRSFSPGVVYTYLGVTLPVVFLTVIRACAWIADIRTSPAGQDLEFARILGDRGGLRRIKAVLKRRLYGFMLRRANLVVCISAEVADELHRLYGVLPDRLFVQPLGVDLAAFSRSKSAPSTPRRAGGNGDFLLVYVGSIARQRGIDTLLEALRMTRAKGIPARLLLVGDGPARDISALASYADELAVSDFVEWTGLVPHERVPELLLGADVAVSALPDIEAYRVSSPGKVFEYLAVPMAVIASEIEAHRKILSHGVDALLVPPGDPGAIADAVETVFRSEALRARLEQGARQTAAKFSWDVMLPRLEERILAAARTPTDYRRR